MTIQSAKQPERISLSDVRSLLGTVMTIPSPWIAVVGVAAVASAFGISFKQGALEVTFQLTAITASLIALAWLPALVQVVALGGGGVKTPAGEATTGGLVDVLHSLAPETRREALPTMIAALGTDPSRDDPAVKVLRRDLEHQLAELPVEATQARERLIELARTYEKVRETMQSGPARTFRMSQLFAEARGLAAAARMDPMYLSEIYARQTDGDRLITLAAIQGQPDRKHIPIVIDSVKTAHSPFEQYQALRTAERMLPLLKPEDLTLLAQAIRDRQAAGAEGVPIDQRDSDRWDLANRLLKATGSTRAPMAND